MQSYPTIHRKKRKDNYSKWNMEVKSSEQLSRRSCSTKCELFLHLKNSALLLKFVVINATALKIKHACETYEELFWFYCLLSQK